MAPRTPLDLISTPVPVLPSTGLVTTVGLSGDDPLAERHRHETYRVLVSVHGPDGRLVARPELEPVGPGERRLVDLTALVRPLVGDADVLTVVHRVPVSTCPPGADPAAPLGGPVADYEMYRTMVQFSVPGGSHGGVIYETPPGFNDPSRPKPGTALMFTSKVVLGGGADTLVCAMNGSVDLSWSHPVPLRTLLLDDAGTEVAREERAVPPFGVSVLDLGDVAARAGHVPARATTHSAVAWSRTGSLVFLVLQVSAGHVAVEHTHPPQAYLLPDAPATRYRMKDEAIAAWDRRFAGSPA